MARRVEYRAGEAVPQSGAYELHNVFGSPMGEWIELAQGQPFPAVPHGHSWIRVEDQGEAESRLV